MVAERHEWKRYVSFDGAHRHPDRVGEVAIQQTSVVVEEYRRNDVEEDNPEASNAQRFSGDGAFEEERRRAVGEVFCDWTRSLRRLLRLF